MSSRTLDPELVDLVARAQNGDGEAFARIYDRYLDQIYGFVYSKVRKRELAEDLTSDVFLRALRSLPRFSWQGVDLGAWLVTIARNRVTDHFKSARVRLEHPTDDVAVHDRSTPDVDELPEAALVMSDVANALHAAIRLLSDDHREVLELRFVQSLSVAESAAAMDRTEGAIKALQYRALRALAVIVNEDPSFSEEMLT
ncbi:MAG: sigma-70 family RNA polymerase sigma factor [Nitriliruptorales bacterium]